MRAAPKAGRFVFAVPAWQSSRSLELSFHRSTHFMAPPTQVIAHVCAHSPRRIPSTWSEATKYDFTTGWRPLEGRNESGRLFEVFVRRSTHPSVGRTRSFKHGPGMTPLLVFNILWTALRLLFRVTGRRNETVFFLSFCRERKNRGESPGYISENGCNDTKNGPWTC